MDDEVYWLVRFEYPAHLEEAVTELAWELGSLGCEETGSGRARRRLLVYFSREVDEAELRRRIEESFSSPGDRLELDVSVSPFSFDPEFWLKRYAASFSGFEIDRDIYIHPPWNPPSQGHSVNVEMEPGHGFGTGTHESTQLAIRALKPLSAKSRSLIDVGTGSGILSITALKLNPALRVTAFDIDQMAVEAAADNLRKNGLGKVDLFTGESHSVSIQADLVLANLTSPLLQTLCTELKRLTQRHLIISGFTQEELPQLEHLFTQASPPFRLTRRYRKRGWISFQLDRCGDS